MTCYFEGGNRQYSILITPRLPKYKFLQHSLLALLHYNINSRAVQAQSLVDIMHIRKSNKLQFPSVTSITYYTQLGHVTRYITLLLQAILPRVYSRGREHI